MKPGFTEDWFARESQSVLVEQARFAPADGLVVEIGSWEGRSTVALANAIAPRVVHAVDTWMGSPGEISATLATQRDIFGQFSTNVEAFTDGNVVVHRMGWREWLPTVTEPIAFAFIDAEHSFSEVRDNILALLPLMAPGGIICGDDIAHLPVREAVRSVLDEDLVWVKASLWCWRCAGVAG